MTNEQEPCEAALMKWLESSRERTEIDVAFRAGWDARDADEPEAPLEDMTIGDCVQVGGTVFPAGTRASIVLGRIRLRSIAERIAEVNAAGPEDSTAREPTGLVMVPQIPTGPLTDELVERAKQIIEAAGLVWRVSHDHPQLRRLETGHSARARGR